MKGSDLRRVDMTGIDSAKLTRWLERNPRAWRRLPDGSILADVDLIVDMNWWGIGIDNEARDEFRHRWKRNAVTAEDVRGRMALRCRFGRHAWRWSSMDIGRSTTFICGRCLKHDLIVTQERTHYEKKPIDIRVRAA